MSNDTKEWFIYKSFGTENSSLVFATSLSFIENLSNSSALILLDSIYFQLLAEYRLLLFR